MVYNVPACTSGSASQIPVVDKGEIKSPGYPYDVPEHLSWRWLLEAADNQVKWKNIYNLKGIVKVYYSHPPTKLQEDKVFSRIP